MRVVAPKPSAAEQVGQPTAEQQQTAERHPAPRMCGLHVSLLAVERGAVSPAHGVLPAGIADSMPATRLNVPVRTSSATRPTTSAICSSP